METPIDVTTHPAIEMLEHTLHILAAMLHHASSDVLDWKPAPNRWSIHDVLAHLLDCERAGFFARIDAMLLEDNPFVAPYDQEAVIASGKYAGTPALQLLKQFEEERAFTLKFLLRLPETSLKRTARHGEIGQFTVEELINEWAFHDLGHIRQIAELYRSKVFYPNIGGFRRYYTIHP